MLIKDYKIALTKNGKEYILGNIQSGMDMGFKAWGSSTAFTKLKKEDYQNVPTCITGTVDDYGGVISLVVENVQAVEGYTVDQFFPIKYNEEAYWNALVQQIQSRVSEKGMELCNTILFNNEELVKRFRVEFAAMSFHDNCKSGLLAHTYKVLSNMAHVIGQYQNIINKDGNPDDYKDLLYIGVLLHDIGKTVEMNFGVYQPVSIVTHKYLGLEFIYPYKERIIELYDEDWYYQLVSIMLQHHGSFEDPCRTVAAYIVHQVDVLDANMTLLSQKLEDLNNESGARFKIEDSYLTY